MNVSEKMSVALTIGMERLTVRFALVENASLDEELEATDCVHHRVLPRLHLTAFVHVRVYRVEPAHITHTEVRDLARHSALWSCGSGVCFLISYRGW